VPSTYDIRLIQAGNVIELIEYENLVLKYDKKIINEYETCMKKGRSIEASVDKKKVNREHVIYKARNDVRRLINANVHQWSDVKGNTYKPVFLTLTFAENIQDLSSANKEFRKFIKRLGNYVARDQGYIKYVAVPEFQQRGAVHYHLIMFNLPYTPVKRIAEIWNQGHIWIEAIDHVDNVGAYIVKYMNKEKDDERLIGQKCYFSCRSLHKPKEIQALSSNEEGQALIKLVETLSPSRTYTNEKESEHYGVIRYTQYNTKLQEGVVTWPEIHAYQLK
jgi:hypothetical protein